MMDTREKTNVLITSLCHSYTQSDSWRKKSQLRPPIGSGNMCMSMNTPTHHGPWRLWSLYGIEKCQLVVTGIPLKFLSITWQELWSQRYSWVFILQIISKLSSSVRREMGLTMWHWCLSIQEWVETYLVVTTSIWIKDIFMVILI